MLSRVIVTVIGIPLVYGCLVFNGISRLGLFLFVAIVGVYEFLRMFLPPGESLPLLEFFLSGGILISTQIFRERGLLFSIAFAGLILASAVVLRGLKGDGFKRFSSGIASLLYIPFCLGFYNLLGTQDSQGGVQIFAVLVSIWALDIGAFFSGCSIGGPRLAPNISPKKTFSGALGGIVTCGLTVYGLFHFGFFTTTPVRVMGLGLSIGVFSQLADLFESVLKREAGIKDSGRIFGNHGGMLDRLDSVLFIGPIAYLFLGW
ncbi:MAG: phosphatidate cytidylyltransferase [Candidatus Riflebacteria bacterium]|nr:phosphatidate cytidylyltransferase [Candidatus Riflebacteria bacterium]